MKETLTRHGSEGPPEGTPLWQNSDIIKSMIGYRKNGHVLGLHRVVDETEVLPQGARKLDASLPLYANEMLVSVDALQIDSASFRQLREAFPDQKGLMGQIAAIVAERGKMQNPVTGSGGMLLGTIADKGPDCVFTSWQRGDRIATLVSLTATPLSLQSIHDVQFENERVLVSGHAILFPSHVAAIVPQDLPESVVLAALDVCGAPASVAQLVQRQETVFIVGLGKAGRSTLAALRQKFGAEIKILGVDANPQSVAFCTQNYAGEFATYDATRPISILNWVHEKTQGRGVDFSVNMANIAGAEMASILATRQGGRCLFFGMATNFQKATLGAESVGKDVQLMMGNGFCTGHADFMLELLRQDNILLRYFTKSFGGV